MKTISILPYAIIAIFMTQCSSAQKLDKKPPVKLGEVHYQEWIAGVEGGGSGINLFIPVVSEIPEGIQLDSIYFRNMAVKAEILEREQILIVGRFKTTFNQKPDVIMDADSTKEYGNPIPSIPPNMPFELEDDECVVSYLVGKEKHYFKIENIAQQESIPYPSAPPSND